MHCTDEELILLATSIAMELAKGLDTEELEQLRIVINQISCSLSSLINHRFCKSKFDKNN